MTVTAIKTPKDYRFAISFLKDLEDLLETGTCKDRAKIEEYIREQKRECRRYSRFTPNMRWVCGDYDSYIMLIEFPKTMTIDVFLQVGHNAVGISCRTLMAIETILNTADVIEEIKVRALAVGRLDIIGIGAQVSLSDLLSSHLGTDIAATSHEDGRHYAAPSRHRATGLGGIEQVLTI